MGYRKDLAESEKVLVIKEIAKVKTNKSNAERINRFKRNLNACYESIAKNVGKMSGATSGIILNETRLPNKASTTRNHTIGITISIKS